MRIKNTHRDYSITIVHVLEKGNIFLGWYDNDSRCYPYMNIRTGEAGTIKPSELIGAYLYENIDFGYKE